MAPALTCALTRLLPLILALAGSLDARCFYSFDSRNAKQGNFSSPGHPDPYPGGSLCHYHFRGREWEGVRLVFQHFDLQPPYRAGCLSDYVEILTVDVHNTQRFRGRYCGKDTPPPLLVLTPGVELVFRSGQHVTYHQGFHGEFEFVDEETVTPPTPDDGSARRCGGVLSGAGGVLESPDFPASFPSGLDCVWLLRAAYNHFLYLRVLHLELQSSIADCRRAQLAVLDGYGPHDGSGKPLRTYCGDLKYYSGPEERALLSPRNRLLVRFTSAKEAAVAASSSAPSPKPTPRTFGFRLVWTQISFDTAENCTRKGQFVCRHSEFCVSDSGGNSGNNNCGQRRFYCVAPSLVCDGQDNCQEGDNSDEVDCYVSLLVAASIAAPVVLLIPALVVCACHRKRARRKAAMLLHAPVSTDTMTPLRPRPLHQSPSRSRPQQLSSGSPDHYPQTTFGLISPASGFSDPLDDDNESELTEIRRNSYHRPMVNLSNGYCPTHGHLSHSPLPSSSDSPRGSMTSDLTSRFQSPLPSSLSSPHPTRHYPTISPRPPRQRQAATMTSPTHLSYQSPPSLMSPVSILRHPSDQKMSSSTFSVRSVMSPQVPRVSQHGRHMTSSPTCRSITSSNIASPATPRHFQTLTPQHRPSSAILNDEVLCSTVTTFGVSVTEIPTMSQRATDV